ncbi:MAG TPA: 4-alpha-glucanotransferase, partial [Ilumatobacteraceae bacterium]|nr:4-alpha-glucanotransferase [Ilumatobacteraceae bacterium]
QWWVPHGNRATDGAYVRYPLDELIAVVCLEAARAGAVVVGENLGVVPPEINVALSDHRLLGIFVHQDIIPTYGRGDRQWSKRSDLAMLSTHDGVPFAGYWDAADIKRQFKHDLIDAEQLANGEAERAEARTRLIFALRETGLLRADAWVDDLPEIMRAAAVELASQDAQIAIYPLEDLWLETRPQNTPGTFQEEPNWRRTATVTLSELATDVQANATLDAIAQARAQAAARDA